MKPKKQRKVWCFNFARRIWYHKGIIQTSCHSSKKMAMHRADKLRDLGWAVYEIYVANQPKIKKIKQY